MTFKQGVEHDKLHPDLVAVLPLVEMEYNKTRIDYGLLPDEMVITSGHEETSRHGDKSRHYIRNCKSGFGEAVDIRVNELHSTAQTEVCGRIAMQLRMFYPNQFKVFFEDCLKPNAHCHIQRRGDR